MAEVRGSDYKKRSRPRAPKKWSSCAGNPSGLIPADGIVSCQMAIIVGLTQPGRPHERFRDRGDRPPPLAVRCGAAAVVGERGGPGAGRLPRGAKPRGWVAGAAAPGKNHRPPSLLLLRSWPVGLGRPLARGHAARAR